MNHPLLDALTAAGGTARGAELARTMGVHRNTLARWVRDLEDEGKVQRVSSRTIRLAARCTPSSAVRPTVEKESDQDRLVQRLNESIARVEELARKLEALCAARLEVHQTAPNCTTEVHQTAPNCTTEVHHLARVHVGAFPPAVFVSNNCSSIAREGVHNDEVHNDEVHNDEVHNGEMHNQQPAIEQPAIEQALSSPPENPADAIEERRALNRKRQAFIRAYQELWKNVFPQQTPEPIGILSSMRHFASHALAEFTEAEWRSSVQQWLDDAAMTRQGWPVRFLIAGLGGEFSPKSETVPCEPAPQGTDADRASIRLSDTLRSDGWLYESEWRDWKLQEDCPILAAQLFTMQFPWEGVGSVYPPMRATDDGTNVALEVTGTSAGHWAVDNIEALRWAARRANRTLTRVACAATGYVWAEFEAEPVVVNPAPAFDPFEDVVF